MKLRLTCAAIFVLISSVAAIYEFSAGDVFARQIEPVTLHLVSDGPPGNFDPLDAVNPKEVIDPLYLGLTILDPTSETIQPSLAESWEVSADGLTWRFMLRDDVLWVRWNPVLNQVETVRTVTAHDVLYGIQGINARAIDDFTLEIRLSAPDESFLNLTPSLRAMPQDVIESLGEHWTVPGNLVTNGPFVLDEWVVGVRRVYLHNPLFPQAIHGPGNVLRVIVDILPEAQLASAGLALYRKNMVDIMFSGDTWLTQPWVSGEGRYDWITIDQETQLIARKSWSYPTPEPLP